MAGFFTGAGGGLIGGLFGLAGAGIDAASSREQQERQIAHDKDMAALNQQNTLEQMSVQNQYQIDQWNRENEYNNPSAVAARYRDAGINPRAAFGQGSASGAGIAGGLSSAPSGSNTGSSSNIMFGTKFAGLGDAVLAGARLQAQNQKDMAEAKLKEEQAASELYERQFIKPHTARLQSALADKGVSESVIKAVEAQWAPYMADLKGRLMEGNLNEQLQRINESAQRILESKAVTALKEEERNLVKQEIIEAKERTLGYAYERAYKRALTTLSSVQLMNVQMDTALKSAQKGHFAKLAEHIDKEIEFLGKRMQLSDEQIKQWKHIRQLNWSKFAAQTAKWTSEEVRGYMFGWIPGNNKPGNSSNFQYDDVPMFAD